MSVFRSVNEEAKALWSEGRGRYLAAVASGWGFLLGTRMVYPVLLPYLRDSFGLTLTTAGLLVSVLWLGSAVGQLPGGILADRYSERTVMTAGAVVVALSLVFVVVAPTAVVLFVATAFAGLGQSLYPIARITILSSIYPDRIGSALGVTMAMGDLGQTVIPPVAGMVAVTISWEFGMVFLIPILVLVAFMLWIALPQTEPTESAVDTLSVESFRYVFGELRRSNLVFVALILFLYILVWQSFTGFYPTYLAEVKRMSSSTAGLIFSVFFAFGVVVKPLAGAAYDRIGMRNALILVLIGPMVGFAALPFITGFWPLVGVTAIVSTMLGSGAITQSYLSDSLSEDIEGTGLGVVRTAVSSLGASGPVLFGMVADRGYFDEGYVLLALVTGLVIILTYRLPTPESS